MPKTVACIIVRNDRAFRWLGHMPVIKWLLVGLREVRGIEQIVCVASAKCAVQAKKFFAADADIDIVAMPDKVAKSDDPTLDEWLTAADGPAALADIVAVLTGTTPFLPAGKIEQCVMAVRRRAADRAATTMTVPAHTEAGYHKVHAEQPGCRVFAPARVGPRICGRFKPVEVTKVESLDVGLPDDSRIANAIVGTR